MSIKPIKEVELGNGDKLVLLNELRTCLFDGMSVYESLSIYTIAYLKRDPVAEYIAHNCELFPLSQFKKAEEAFERRLKENTVKGNNLGMTLEEIYNLYYKKKDEIVYVVTCVDGIDQEHSQLIGVFTSKVIAESMIEEIKILKINNDEDTEDHYFIYEMILNKNVHRLNV